MLQNRCELLFILYVINATSSNQMDVDNIATRMKSNKRRRKKTNEQTHKK
jgi:hypothetical protein